MMSPQMWAGQRVQAFFQGCNWKGESPKLPPLTPLAEETAMEQLSEIDLMNLKLQDFLGHSNWCGLSRQKTCSHSAVESKTPIQVSLSLGDSVQHFFNRFPWQGNILLSPAIASETPKKKGGLAEKLANADGDWKVTDLSDLL